MAAPKFGASLERSWWHCSQYAFSSGLLFPQCGHVIVRGSSISYEIRFPNSEMNLSILFGHCKLEFTNPRYLPIPKASTGFPDRLGAGESGAIGINVLGSTVPVSTKCPTARSSISKSDMPRPLWEMMAVLHMRASLRETVLRQLFTTHDASFPTAPRSALPRVLRGYWLMTPLTETVHQ